MSEYIVEIPEEPAKVVHDGWNVRIEWQYKMREKIVRCRDCAECEHWEATERKPERYICLTNYCIEVNPNGFCAWGERREIE